MVREAAVLTLLALSAPATAQPVAERLPTCLACHGATGTSTTDGVPSLGAMPVDYVLTQLYLFREKIRKVELMNAMAEGLSDDDLRALGDAIHALPAPEPAPPLPEAERTAGQALVDRLRCNSCHGAKLEGQGTIPRIAGQRTDYLRAALTGYKDNSRRGYSAAMNEAAQELKPADIELLSRYVPTLP
jgi:cytochrome c553